VETLPKEEGVEARRRTETKKKPPQRDGSPGPPGTWQQGELGLILGLQNWWPLTPRARLSGTEP